MLGIDDDGTLWCEADLVRGKSAEWLAEQAVAHQVAFRSDSFAIETNQFQQLFAVIISMVAQKKHVLVPIVEVQNTVRKEVRIRRLGPYLAHQQIRFRNTPGTRLLVAQLREFPEGANDDGADSLEQALRVMDDLLTALVEQRGR
jgi:predicted phage terminase large subunit-like protein